MRLRMNGGPMRRKLDWRVRSALAVAGQLALTGCEKGTALSQAADVTAPTAQAVAQAAPGHGALKTQGGEVPLGAVIDWWRPDPTFPVPDGFLIADGSRVVDPKSPLDGMLLPDLRGKFVRGSQDAAGIGSSGGASTHTHSASPPPLRTVGNSHRHEWASTYLTPAGETQWTSWNGGGFPVLIIFWGNGIGAEGAGYFPLATGSPGENHFYTDAAYHDHDVNVPTFTTAAASSEPPYVGLLKIVRVR